MVRIIAKRRLQPLSRWLEEVVRLPAGIAADPGPLKLHPYQRAIADAIGDCEDRTRFGFEIGAHRLHGGDDGGPSATAFHHGLEKGGFSD